MDDSSFWTLAAKYFAGEASDQETKRLETWLEADAARRALLAEAAAAWEKAGNGHTTRVNAAAAWKRLEGRIEQAEARPKPIAGVRDRPSRPARQGRLSPLPRWGLLAGGVALALAVFFAVLPPDSPGNLLTTERGERTTVRLVDGTHVYLNAESRLSLLRISGQGVREVHLEGEAFFEVAHDAARPFLVHTHQGVIRVVGTAFNVAAYPEARRVTVAVAEGAVALPTRPSAPADTVVLRPHQLGVLADQHVQALYRGVDLSAHLAWREGRLVFENTPFPEVVRRLERWYDLPIEMPPPQTLEHIDRLNAILDQAPADAAIRDIALALGLHYHRAGDTLRFYPSPAP